MQKGFRLMALLVTVCAPLAMTPVSVSGQSQKKQTQSKKSETVRTLDAINIEGQIAVPQVLFITSRDFRRYRDGLGAKFRPSSLEIARSADLPARLRFIAKNKEELE